MATSSSRPELLVIVGETASGKSKLAMKIAKQFNGEIISADSWMVYKSFDVGTAKPTPQEQKQIKHHLLDVTEADKGFSAPLFKQMAEAATADIQKRGKLPILVGGTGLYIDSLLFNYGFLPGAGEEERVRLNKKSLDGLLEEAKAKKIDLSGIDLRNIRRIIRAIEAKGQKPTKEALRPGVLVVGVRANREELTKKVQQRTEKMFSKGLEAEVRQLAQQYGWDAEPMKGIGYREFKACFDGTQNLEETKKRLISNTLNLAKRQRTWFKRHKFIRWFDSPEQAYQEVSKLLNN